MPSKVKVKITKQQAAKIKRLFGKETSLNEISRQTGLGYYHVRKTLLELGEIQPGQGLKGGRKFSPLPKKELRALLKEYGSPRGVAEYLRRDPSTIKRYLDHHNIKWRKK